MFETVFIYVPTKSQIIRISEGTGDNLSEEDIKACYVDYIYYDQYELGSDIREVDGGMVMLTQPFQKKYESTKACIPDVLHMAYGNEPTPYILLHRVD